MAVQLCLEYSHWHRVDAWMRPCLLAVTAEDTWEVQLKEERLTVVQFQSLSMLTWLSYLELW